MKKPVRRKTRRFSRSETGLAIPITFLVLFVSMLSITSIAYYYAIEKVNARSRFLKVSMAKQTMSDLDERILSILWLSSSSRTLDFDDYGGTLNVQPSTNRLVISVSDSNEISETLFNSTVGQVAYELPYSESADTGLYLRGDSRVILNQSGSVMTQLCIINGHEHPEILLGYRPFASSVALETEDNRTVNDVRVQIVSLNSSQIIELMGKVPLKISCSKVESALTSYTVSYEVNTLTVAASSDAVQGQVAVPIRSGSEGAIINVEVVVCNITIERWVR
jgi:hypothetical protein